MSHVVIECTYDEECHYTARSLSPEVALMKIDTHLQEDHDTTLDEEFEQLEEETGKSIEEIIEEQVQDQTED